MKKDFCRSLFAFVLTLLFVLPSPWPLAARAVQGGEALYTLVTGETDADGNVRADYYVDENGQVVQPEFGMVSAAAQANIPESYDSRQLGAVTAVTNQGGSGSCWAFSTLSCMETSYILQGYGTAEDTAFSPAHLVWFSQKLPEDSSDPLFGDGRNSANPFMKGGSWYVSSATLLRGSGAQLECNAPWTLSWDESNLLSAMTQPESERYTSYARMLNAHKIDNDGNRDAAKQLLMEYGSLMTSYYDDYGAEQPGFNSTYNSYYQTAKTSVTNHAVTVVGWDDNFPRTSFNDYNLPDADGAWLIKGSWGKSYGDGGYYWISYEEPSLSSFVAFQAAPADIYDNIYQYDGTYPSNHFAPSGITMACIANTFTSQRDEDLTYVAFFNENVGATVTAEVYVSDTKPTLEKNDPTAGMTQVTAATTTVTNAFFGYSTVALQTPVRLTAGQYFTVKITYQTQTGTVYIPVEGATVSEPADGQITHGGNVGESFLYMRGNWYDSNDYAGNDLNNVPVKAMTVTVPQVPTLTLKSLPTKTTYTLGESLDLAGLCLEYTDSKGKTSDVTSDCTADTTVLNEAGIRTVTVTYAGLCCTFTVTVETEPTLEILSMPTKQVYWVGDTLDTAGLTLQYTDRLGNASMVSDGFETDVTALQTKGSCTVTVTYESLTCTFTVLVTAIPGDVDDSGSLDLLDVTLILRSIAGGYDVTLGEEAAQTADVNKDGRVDLLDVALLKRYLAGGYGVELR
ncbi:MAG: bacterial Ig-like domain-containing protein [Acutalibacteraceae bacterium]